VNLPRQFHNVALIGFMGTGKTSVGHNLASLLHFHMVDTDDLIEARAGKRINAIFAQDGETKFREFERQIVEDLVRHRHSVIATGGGVVANRANLDSLKTHALIVCLWASPEVIYERVRHQTHRPLLHGPDPLEKIRALLAEREPFYREADVLVNTELRSVREVAIQVAHHFRAERHDFTSYEDEDRRAGS
jgi:shikimate kinase